MFLIQKIIIIIFFFEMIEEKLSKKYNITTINCFRMSTNNDNQYIKV